MFTWTDQPARPPHACSVTHVAGDDHGPFLEVTTFDYMLPFRDEAGEVRVKPIVNRLYLSEQAIREACSAPGSPLVAVPREAQEGQEEQIQVQAELLGEYELRIAELEAEVATLNERPLIDTPALVASLEQHFAKKAGRKPAGDKAA